MKNSQVNSEAEGMEKGLGRRRQRAWDVGTQERQKDKRQPGRQ